jgi:hypothetical protein
MLVYVPANNSAAVPLNNQRHPFALLFQRCGDRTAAHDYKLLFMEWKDDLRSICPHLPDGQAIMTDNCKPLRTGASEALNGIRYTCVAIVVKQLLAIDAADALATGTSLKGLCFCHSAWLPLASSAMQHGSAHRAR